MKKYDLRTILLIFSLIFSTGLHAAWYEVNGDATIVSTKEAARIHAIEDALYKAMSFSGADIGTLSFIQPFLEDPRQEYQFTNHEVRYVRIVNEDTSSGKVRLKVRVDIYPSAKGCHVDQYKKTFAVGLIDILEPTQAVMGSMYYLGKDYGTIISRQLNEESLSFYSVGTTEYEIRKDQPEVVKMLAQDTGAQYLMTAAITDLTATVESSLLGGETINRQFAMEVSVFDGKTGNEMYTKNYREVALWPFPKTSKVDTKGARFWSSTYGEMMMRVSRNVMLDLESELSCKITLPEIVSIKDNTVTIDLGRRHGVKKGDVLQLWHTGAFVDQHGIARNRVSKSDITLTVTRVYDKGAELSINQPNLARSVQIGDVMHKQIFD